MAATAPASGPNRSIGLILPAIASAIVDRALTAGDSSHAASSPVMKTLFSPTKRDPRPLSLARPGGHGEGQDTRSHPELGRENPQRRWYCVSRRGRVGRRQAQQASALDTTAIPYTPSKRPHA